MRLVARFASNRELLPSCTDRVTTLSQPEDMFCKKKYRTLYHKYENISVLYKDTIQFVLCAGFTSKAKSVVNDFSIYLGKSHSVAPYSCVINFYFVQMDTFHTIGLGIF